MKWFGRKAAPVAARPTFGAGVVCDELVWRGGVAAGL